MVYNIRTHIIKTCTPNFAPLLFGMYPREMSSASLMPSVQRNLGVLFQTQKALSVL